MRNSFARVPGTAIMARTSLGQSLELPENLSVMTVIAVPVDAELERVKRGLCQCAEADPVVNSMAPDVIHHGKMLRPKLLLSAAAGLGKVTDEHIQAAVALELVHLGSVFHDDVIDEAHERRGKPCLARHAGNSLAVLAGDYLFAVAQAGIARIGRPDLVCLFAAKMTEVCQGEIEQELLSRGRVHAEPEYFAIIRRKTGGLFALAAAAAGLLCDEEEATGALTECGYEIGVAYQVLDDVADVVGDARLLGKDVNADARQQKLTLPAIRLAAEARDAGGAAAALQTCIDTAKERLALAARLAEEAGSGPAARVREFEHQEIFPLIESLQNRLDHDP